LSVQGDDFDRITSLEQTATSWTPELQSVVKSRIRPLSGKVLDRIFAGLPRAALAWHDAAVGVGHYVTGSIAMKQARITANLKVLRLWAGLPEENEHSV
jgi:hypothetical protein